MNENFFLKPFDANSTEANSLFENMDTVWKLNGGEGVIAADLKQKLFGCDKYEKHPYLLCQEDKVVGMTWPEITTPSYGNITLHVKEHLFIDPMIYHLKKAGYFKNKIMELIHIDPSALYRDCCFKHELIPNIRQRMYLWLNNCGYFTEESHPFQFRFLSKDDIEWTAKLSVHAHSMSKDYQFYDEMINIEKRTLLEQSVWDGKYGNVNSTGSLTVYYNEQPVGYCLLVNVECWGYKNVPWIFDICIDPSFHGQGIGKALSCRFLNNLIEEKFEIMGLAVTLTNQYAINLYEKLGFELLDVFYEFIEL